jgi:hypothetical protein
MGPKPTPAHTLERKDNDGPYSPENCVWVTRKVQMRNTRRNHLVTFDGRTQPVSAWAEETGIRYHTLSNRIRLGWTPEKALTTPVRR